MNLRESALTAYAPVKREEDARRAAALEAAIPEARANVAAVLGDDVAGRAAFRFHVDDITPSLVDAVVDDFVFSCIGGRDASCEWRSGTTPALRLNYRCPACGIDQWSGMITNLADLGREVTAIEAMSRKNCPHKPDEPENREY